MIKIACLKCHWSWSLNHDAIRLALESMDSGNSHYSVECPRCRRVNKIPRRQLEQTMKLMAGVEKTSDATSKAANEVDEESPAKSTSPRSTGRRGASPSAKSGTAKKPSTKKSR
jgi:phage FluMu protein Com